jgi:hypothetical protein
MYVKTYAAIGIATVATPFAAKTVVNAHAKEAIALTKNATTNIAMYATLNAA